MQQRKSLSELVMEIERQETAKADFIAPAQKIQMVLDNDDAPALELRDNGKTQGAFPVGKYAGGQIATKLGIPQKYYDKMKEQAPDLLTRNVNTWLGKAESRHMVRTLDGTARAFLSDAYRPIDNNIVAAGVLDQVQRMQRDDGLEIKLISGEITERKLYIQLVTPKIQAEIKVGDMVQAGLTVSNSEIGHGSAAFEMLLYILSCLNGMTSRQNFRKYHIGSRIGNQSGMDIINFSNETRNFDDRAFMGAMRDMTKQALSEMSLKDEVEHLKRAQDKALPLNAINETVQEIKKVHSLTDSHASGILGRLIQSGDLTQFGLSAAVTNLANDGDEVPDYENVIKMQQVGSKLMYMSEEDFNKLGRRAEAERALAAEG